jgi:hypothetical protein
MDMLITTKENAMKSQISKTVLFICLAIILSACGVSASAPESTPTTASSATATVVPTQTPTSTATVIPSQTPKPTSTPNLAATQRYDSFQGWLEKLAADGSIPSINGRYYMLDDYSDSLAKIGYFNWSTYNTYEPTNFIIQAKVQIANETTENAFKSACGFVFKDQFSTHALFFALDGNANYRTNSADRGSKYLDSTLYQNPDGVILTVILSNKALLFYVNDRKAISQTVYAGPFSVGPAILSGTSEGFGTRCDFTELVLWEIE